MFETAAVDVHFGLNLWQIYSTDITALGIVFHTSMKAHIVAEGVLSIRWFGVPAC